MTRGALQRFNEIRKRALYNVHGLDGKDGRPSIELRGQTVTGCASAPRKSTVLELGGVIAEVEQVVRFKMEDFTFRGWEQPVRWEEITVASVKLVVMEWTVDHEAGEYVVSLVSAKVKASA